VIDCQVNDDIADKKATKEDIPRISTVYFSVPTWSFSEHTFDDFELTDTIFAWC